MTEIRNKKQTESGLSQSSQSKAHSPHRRGVLKKECFDQDLTEKHVEACKEESDLRKMKEERKVRKMVEKARVDKNSAELMHKLDDADLAASPAN